MRDELKEKVLYYVTGRASKATLFAQFLPRDAGFRVEQVDTELFEEQTDDQEKIAISKAKQAWSLVQKPLLVDDGAIYFHRYKEFPGTFTKFVYKGLEYEGICRLLDEGDELSVVVTLVLIYGPDTYKLFKISKVGIFRKVHNPDLFFLFDSTFVPQGLHKTYVELKEQDPELFKQYYYRALAAQEVSTFISENDIF
jgi:inosine/xanthosine triphosphate pyrophosphatase family protein